MLQDMTRDEMDPAKWFVLVENWCLVGKAMCSEEALERIATDVLMIEKQWKPADQTWGQFLGKFRHDVERAQANIFGPYDTEWNCYLGFREDVRLCMYKPLAMYFLKKEKEFKVRAELFGVLPGRLRGDPEVQALI